MRRRLSHSTGTMYRRRSGNHDALPPRFAVLTAHATRAHIFDAIRVRSDRDHDHYDEDISTYAVRAHVPSHTAMDHEFPAFLIDGPPYHTYGYGYGNHGTVQFLVEDSRYDIRFRTEWNCVGAALYTMLDASPIPVINVGRTHDLPCLEENRVRVVEGERRELRVWEQRWNPHLITRLLRDRDLEMEQERERERERAREREREIRVRPPAEQITPVPKFVADALIRDAISKSTMCPITMEPLAVETTAVTHCYHLFERNAIATWLASNADHACAVCKTRTVLTL